MIRPYTVSDWYWIVAGDESRVFSSKVGNYVPVSDATYQAWLAASGAPYRIANEEELGELLANARVRPADAAATVVDAYKDRHAREITLQVVAKWMLWATNEIRVLKGQESVSAAQFRNFLKGQM
jgi:hypothetical protein